LRAQCLQCRPQYNAAKGWLQIHKDAYDRTGTAQLPSGCGTVGYRALTNAKLIFRFEPNTSLQARSRHFRFARRTGSLPREEPPLP
jgi:hypothetical protein